jgi:hypothetical protein
MKMILFFILGFILMAGLPQAAMAAADQTGSSASGISRPAQSYFPGDVVHVVVSAPIDTDSVSALMPDGQELSMIYDRRNKIWHNFWQVPVGFRKGTYTAKLNAVDIEGRNFEGETSPIFVDEPTLPVVMQFTASEEVKPAPVAAPPAVAKPKETVRAATPPVKAKRKVAAQPKEDFNVKRLRYITLAKNYVANQEYEKAKVQLEALLKIDPENKEVKVMLNRIEAIIKAKETTL